MRLLSVFSITVMTASPVLAMDDCLLGVWQADLDALSQIMGRQMNGTATPVGGDVTMTIVPEGMADMTIDGLVMNMVAPDVPPMNITINGSSSGNFSGDAGDWSVTTASYALVGSADVLGQTMAIPFDSSTGMFGSGSGTYICDEATLTFTSDSADARIPPRWSRKE